MIFIHIETFITFYLYMIKLSKLFFIPVIIFFSSSCRKDGDKLIPSEGYNVGSYFIEGSYNNEPIFKTDFIGEGIFGISDIYSEINPYSNPIVVSGQKSNLDISFRLNAGDFSLSKLQIKDIEIENLSRKQIYFTDIALSEQSNLDLSNINQDDSYLKIDTVILPSERYTLPRIIGSLYLELGTSSNPKQLDLSKFELPFNNS